MDTAVAQKEAPIIDIEESVFGHLTEERPHDDPRVVRWGYNPGLRFVALNPRETGLREPFVPIGKFLAHTTFQTPRENCTLDEYKVKEYLVDVTAADSQSVFERAFREWGYQSFFYGETDAVKLAVINETLLPTLSEIRSLFGDESPIDEKCKGEDEMDLGSPRSHCATCHLQWINSKAADVLIDDVIRQGRTRTVRKNDGQLEQVTVSVTAAEFETARTCVRTGLEIYIRKATTDWSKTLTELENKKRDQIQEEEHYLRKDLHLISPMKREIEVIERMAQAQMKVNKSSSSPDVLEMLAENQRSMAEMMAKGQERTDQLLAAILTQKPNNPSDNNKTDGQVAAKIKPAK